MNQLSCQKYVFTSILFLINIGLSYLIYIYKNYWYYFIILISLNTVVLILQIIILPCSIFIKQQKDKKHIEINNKNIVYCIPCYNESKSDINKNINSYLTQTNVDTHKKMLIIICDGMGNIGKYNDKSTDYILVNEIFKDYIDNYYFIQEAYQSDGDDYNGLHIYSGNYQHLENNTDFILIIKENNKGKKDTLFLIRSLLFKFNNLNIPNTKLSDPLIYTFIICCINFTYFDAIIATDADTVINNTCFYYLIKELYNYKENVVGIAGIVKISQDISICNFWYLYQFTNYLHGQLINRLHQSLITSRVSCLPGCLQILKINKVSCGNQIMDRFIKSKKNTKNLFRYLKFNLGEDVRHTMLMHKYYPDYSHTKQSLYAEAYTQIPIDLTTFLCQRRRWMIGGFMNELEMVKNNYNLYETCILILFTITFLLIPFITFTYFIIFKELFIENNKIWLNVIILLVIFIIPKFYLLFTPFIINVSCKETITLYIGLLIYNFIEIFLNLIVYFYSFYNFDNISWGKTRENKDKSSFSSIETPRNLDIVI